MHAILDIKEAVRVPSLNQTGVHRCGAFYFKIIGWPQLFLVTHQYDLLGIKGSKECLLLLDHGRLVHDDPLELTLAKLLCASFTNRGHDNFRLIKNALLKRILVVHKDFELLL